MQNRTCYKERKSDWPFDLLICFSNGDLMDHSQRTVCITMSYVKYICIVS